MSSDRRPKARRYAALLCGGLWLLLGPTAGLWAQEREFRGWEEIRDEGYVFDPDSSEVATFAILTSGDVRHRLRVAEDAMRRGAWREAFEPLQEIVDLFPYHLYQVGEDRWVGAAEYARFLLSQFPPQARDGFAAWAELRAAPASRAALRERDPRRLLSVFTDWPTTPQGAFAARAAGDLEFERGAFDLASRIYRRRLSFEWDVSLAPAADLLRAAIASSLSGRDGEAEALLARLGERRAEAFGAERSPADVLARIAAWPRPESEPWPVFGGENDRAGRAEGAVRPVRLRDRWWVDTFSRPELNPYARARSDQEFPFHAVAARDTIVLCDGLTVRALPLFSGEPRWTFEGPLFDPGMADDHYTFEDYAPTASGPLGSLARSLPLAAAIARGRVLAPLLELQPRGRRISFDKTDITIPIPRRGLYCLDLATGKLLWRQTRPNLGPDAFVNRLSVSVPPLVVGDHVYTVGYVLEGAINLFVLCFSLTDGELLWKTPLVVGQQELTMFNKSFKEFTLQMPAESDGALYVCSNVGLFACVDALSGQPRWVTRYESIPIRGSLHYTQPRERPTTSANDPPLVCGDVVVFYPFDSNSIYGVDRFTGRRIWSISAYSRRREPTRYSHLLGVDDGVVVLAGRYGIGFFDAASGDLLARYSYGRLDGAFPRGRGCLAAGVVYQPLSDRLLILHHRRTELGYDVEDQWRSWEPEVAGNFLRLGDVDLVLSRRWVSGFYDLDALIAEARRQAAAPDASVDALLLLGELEARRGDYAASLAVFTRARAAAEDADQSRRARAGLYRCHRRLAELAEIAGDEGGRIEHLEAQARLAEDDHAFLQTAEVLLDLYEKKGDRGRMEALLDEMDVRCADVDYPFGGLGFGGLVRTGVFTLERRAAMRLEQGDAAQAVAAYQRAIERYGDLPYGSETVGEHARRRIAEIVDRFGPDVYARFDQEARRLHERAVAAGDLALLGEVIRRFPNSPHATRFRLDYARLLLEGGEPGKLFETLGPLLGSELGESEMLEVLALLARGAEAAGDEALAASVWKRVLSRAGEGTEIEGRSLRDLARREAARLDERSAADEPRRAKLLTWVHGPPVAFELDLDDDTRLVPIRGAPPADGEGVFVYSVERRDRTGAAESRAYLRFLAFRDGGVDEVWRAPVDVYFHEGDPVAAWWIGGRLVVRQGRVFRGFDPGTGTLLFERRLPRVPFFTRTGVGLLYVVWTRPDGGTSLAALESASGSFFWQRRFDRPLDGVEARGDTVLVLLDDAQVEALDALTGEVRFSKSLLEIPRAVEVSVLEDFDLFLASGSDREAGTGRIVAFDLRDGRRLWQKGDLSPRVSTAWVQAVPGAGKGEPGRIALLQAYATINRAARAVVAVDVLEPRSGRALTRIDDLPRLSAFERGPLVFGRRLVLVEEGRRRRLRRPTPRALVSIDVDTGERRSVPLELLEGDRYVDFTVYATADGRLQGTIEGTDLIPSRGSQSALLRFDPRSLELAVERVPSRYDIYRALSTALPHALVVLKDDQLLWYPVEGAKRR